jgi:multidrug resistance protein MdtO
MAVVFAGAFVSAWIAAGSPAIAYAGFQVAFAFFLCVLQGAGPAFDLTIARDRVIGILLGNLVAYLVFTRWWPASVVRRIDPAFGGLLRQLGGLLTTPPAKRAAALTGIAASSGALTRDLSLAGYEPWPMRPSTHWLRTRRRLLRRVLAATAPLALAADDSGATAWRQRLERAADRIDGAGVASSPSAVAVSDDAAGPLAERALREIERTLPDPRDEAAGEAGHAHALA